MTKAELQYNKIIDLQNPALSTSYLNIEATLKHLVEVINEMQEEFTNEDNLK